MKRADRTWILYAVVFVLLATVSYGLYRYTASVPATGTGSVPPQSTQEPRPDEQVPEEGAPKILFEGGEWTRKDVDGTLLWRVKAEGEIEYQEEKRRLQAGGIVFEVHRQGKPAVRLEAPRFVADYDGQRLTFQQGIRGEVIGGVGHFTVNSIEYQAANNKLVGTGGAEFIYGGYSARAETLVIDVENARTRLRGDVVLGGRYQ